MSCHGAGNRLHLTLLLSALLLMRGKEKKTCAAVRDAISDFVNIHFVVTEECGHLKYTLSDGKATKAAAACSGSLWPTSFSPGEPHSAAGGKWALSQVLTEFARGLCEAGKKKSFRKLNISSSRLMKRRVDGEPPKNWHESIVLNFWCAIFGRNGQNKRKEETKGAIKICLWRMMKAAWNHNSPRMTPKPPLCNDLTGGSSFKRV